MERRRVALVTGGATGIGRAVAQLLATSGIAVAINYSVSGQEAEETAETVRSKGVPCLIVKADVTDDRQVREMVGAVVGRMGGLDYLVNSAGVTNFVDMADLEGLKEEYWDRAFNVNVKGTFFVCRAAAPCLKAARGGIVNITSLTGIHGRGSSIAYAASKGAEITLTKSLAHVLAPEVRVNSVAPGIVKTRWVAGRDEQVRHAAAATPLGRVCEAEDVAQVVVSLLLSAGMMTGQNVIVDGGIGI
jgi:3-oxoacyl-[acyl-carrier protein] reductase